MNPLEIAKSLFEILVRYREMGYERRRERFENIFMKIYTDIVNVNEYYMKLFSDLRESLPAHVDDQVAFVFHEEGDYNHYLIKGKEYNEKLERIKKRILSEERDSNDRLRDQIKANVYTYILLCKSDEEKRFIHSIVKYFLEHHGYSYSDIDEREIEESKRLEKFLEFIHLNNFSHDEIESMISSNFETPKSLVYTKIVKLDDAEEMKTEISDKENQLNRYMNGVSSSYVHLQSSIYSGRP